MEQLNTLIMVYSLLFTGSGFALGLFYNNRKVVRLEEKVLRLKRTIRHLQRHQDEDTLQEDAVPPTNDLMKVVEAKKA